MINIENLSFSYKTKVPLFKDLNFEAETGRIYGLLGKNGAGKTSLLKIMAGLLHPKSGAAVVNGYRSSQRHPAHLASYYMMPEEFISPPVSVSAFLRINAPFYPNFDVAQFRDYLQQFDLDASGKISRFSYGQKKKFFLAFGLASNAPIFIADEPTNGLDIPSKSVFRKIVASALTDERLFIISTHQVRDIEGLPDKLAVIDEGHIIFNQTTDAVSDKLHFYSGNDEAYMDSPDLLYSESSMGGFQCILRNTEDHFSKPDTELLFNALTAENSKVRELFN